MTVLQLKFANWLIAELGADLRERDARVLRHLIQAHVCPPALLGEFEGGIDDAVANRAMRFRGQPAAHRAILDLISRLYERTSIIVTTNLAFGEWPSVVADPR